MGVQSNPHPNPNHGIYFLGLSYPNKCGSLSNTFDLNNAATVALFKDSGSGVLKFFFAQSTTGAIPWDPDGAGLKYGVTPATADITSGLRPLLRPQIGKSCTGSGY